MKPILYGMASAALLSACNSGSVGSAGGGAFPTPAIPQDKTLEANVEKTLKQMTVDEKVGQMVQITIDQVMDGIEVDEAKLEEVVGRYKVGSILNVIASRAQTAAHTARVVRRFQEVSMEKIGIPCLYGLDQIHGATYLSDAVFFPQLLCYSAAKCCDARCRGIMGLVVAYGPDRFLLDRLGGVKIGLPGSEGQNIDPLFLHFNSLRVQSNRGRFAGTF
jgi:beta-glucosidase